MRILKIKAEVEPGGDTYTETGEMLPVEPDEGVASEREAEKGVDAFEDALIDALEVDEGLLDD